MTANEEPDFRPIGSLLPPTGNSPQGSASTPTARQTNSATTGTPRQGNEASSSTGRQRGGTGVAVQTSPAPTHSPGDIHRHLRALAERRRNGQFVKSDDAQKWLVAAPPRQIVEELTKLRMLTAARNPGDDLDLLVTAYAERMAEYPLDIIRAACREMADKSTFFPAWAELRAAMDEWLTSRREIVAGLLEPPPASMMKYQPLRLLADLLLEGRTTPINDREREWLRYQRQMTSTP